MRSRIIRISNSLGLRLPRSFLKKGDFLSKSKSWRSMSPSSSRLLSYHDLDELRLLNTSTSTRFAGSEMEVVPPSRARDLSQQVACDDHPMHFRGAFADATDARLAIPALERKFLAHAVTAVNLHRAIDHAAEHLARI
jgi:hypothetical protein